MDDELQPGTAPARDLDSLQIVYDIVHTRHARFVMSSLYHGRNLDDTATDATEPAVTRAVSTLQELGIVRNDTPLTLTDQGMRLQAVFEEIESGPQ